MPSVDSQFSRLEKSGDRIAHNGNKDKIECEITRYGIYEN